MGGRRTCGRVVALCYTFFRYPVPLPPLLPSKRGCVWGFPFWLSLSFPLLFRSCLYYRPELMSFEAIPFFRLLCTANRSFILNVNCNDYRLGSVNYGGCGGPGVSCVVLDAACYGPPRPALPFPLVTINRSAALRHGGRARRFARLVH